MHQVALYLIPVPLIIFWLWMFHDMLENDDVPPDARPTWIVAFVIGNILTAGYYYFTEYRRE